MARYVRRTANFYDIEILRSAAGLEDIMSKVVDSTHIPENPSGSGRYVLVAGNVMGKISGDASGRIAPIAGTALGSGGAGAWTAADIVGILAQTKEFALGPGMPAAGTQSDEEVAVLHHLCDFNVSKLTGYTGNETIVAQALPTCKFR